MNIDEVNKLHPALVEKNLKTLKSTKCKEVNVENLVFYHCSFLSDNNKCLIYEDRPNLCREFPDSPLLVLAPGCAYEKWAADCKEKHFKLKEERLKYKEELESIRYQRKAIRLLEQLQRITNDKDKLAFLLPSLNLVSPGASWMKFY